MAVVYSERGVLDDHARESIAAAALLSDPLTEVIAVVLGELKEDVAVCGADRVLVFAECDARQFAPEHALDCIAAALQRFTPMRLFLPERARESDLGRRLAAGTGMSIATHVVELDRHQVARRVGNSKRLARRALTDVVLLAADTIETSLPFVGRGDVIETPKIAAAATAYIDKGVYSLPAEQIPLEQAHFVVAAGNGVKDIALFEQLARALGASIGASRVAVDDGRFARDRQVGVTGKTIGADVYLAIGISGAIQHLLGIEKCQRVIAINRDAAAPIVKRADLTVIADAQELMQALLAELGAQRGAAERAA